MFPPPKRKKKKTNSYSPDKTEVICEVLRYEKQLAQLPGPLLL